MHKGVDPEWNLRARICVKSFVEDSFFNGTLATLHVCCNVARISSETFLCRSSDDK